MEVISLTVFVGLILVAGSLLLFIYQRAMRINQSMEHESLLPLAEEQSVPANKKSPLLKTPKHD